MTKKITYDFILLSLCPSSSPSSSPSIPNQAGHQGGGLERTKVTWKREGRERRCVVIPLLPRPAPLPPPPLLLYQKRSVAPILSARFPLCLFFSGSHCSLAYLSFLVLSCSHVVNHGILAFSVRQRRLADIPLVMFSLLLLCFSGFIQISPNQW